MDLDSSVPETAPTSPALMISFFRWTDFARDGVTSAEVEAADLTRGNVDIIRAGEVGAVSGTEESKSVLKPENARNKILFENLTPLHANKRLRMERGNGSTEDLTARVLDLASPIGRGQRGLIAIRPRWPRPIGDARSSTRAVKSSVEPLPRSIRRRLFACSGVRFSNRILLRAFSGFRTDLDSSVPETAPTSPALMISTFPLVKSAASTSALVTPSLAKSVHRKKDIIRAGEVGAVSGTEESKSILKDLQHAITEDVFAAFRVLLQD